MEKSVDNFEEKTQSIILRKKKSVAQIASRLQTSLCATTIDKHVESMFVSRYFHIISVLQYDDRAYVRVCGTTTLIVTLYVFAQRLSIVSEIIFIRQTDYFCLSFLFIYLVFYFVFATGRSTPSVSVESVRRSCCYC